MIFSQQIFAESIKLLHSKFIIISSVIVLLLVSLFFPLIVYYLDNYYVESSHRESFSAAQERAKSESLTVNGIEIVLDNWVAMEIQYELTIKDGLENSLTGEALMHAEAIIDEKISFWTEYYDEMSSVKLEGNYYFTYATILKGQIPQRYVYSLDNFNAEEMRKALEANTIYDFNMLDYDEMTINERRTKHEEISRLFDSFHLYVKEGDVDAWAVIARFDKETFTDFYKYLVSANEQMLLEDPTNEATYLTEIAKYEAAIKYNEEIYEANIQYRQRNDILPETDTWQNHAIHLLSSATWTVLENPYRFEENFFYTAQGFVDEYGTYEKYMSELDKQLLTAQHDLLSAEKSLDTGRPDMAVSPNGARQRFYEVFNAQFVVIIFAVMIGGYCMANEYRSGTIRLLLIRPKSRIKILLSHFFSGLLLLYFYYVLIILIMLLMQGFLYGFSDYFNPNYTPNGEQSFFIMLFLDTLSLSTVFVFMYSFAFSCSILFKSIEVAIIVPVFLLFGATILMQSLDINQYFDLLSFTPIPYISFDDFIVKQDDIKEAFVNANHVVITFRASIVNLFYGVLFALMATCVFIKSDITE